MLSISSILALFVLLLIASATFFAAKKLRLPYTVLLVIVGLLLVPIIHGLRLSSFEFLETVVLTPELLFFVFLPILIFESAFNMNMRKLIENAWHISLLAIVGLLISTAIIATAVYGIFGLIGLPIPFIVALLFGALISSTDPVAVLALFKEYRAPKRLTLIFEGESLFNDGTAVALFLVVLAVATNGFHGTDTVIEGIGVFGMMLGLGIAFGILMATIFSRALRFTKGNEFVSITVLLVSAHMVFILSELINRNPIFGLHLHISPIIATTVAALFLGTYARHILSPKSDEYLQKSIEHLAFVANSLVFLLAGLLFAATDIDVGRLWLPIVITILIVATARAISVFAVVLPLNILRPVSAIPKSWQLMLAWGSLRGALAIIAVLLIPEGFTLPGWSYDFTPRELLLALTVGCILATLFIKATTIGYFITKLGLNKPTKLQQATLLDNGLYYLLTERARVTDLSKRGFIQDTQTTNLLQSLQQMTKETVTERNKLLSANGATLSQQALHHAAIAIEQRYLKELYANDEVNEAVYRKILGKLNLQQEKIEYAQHETIDPSSYMDRKDIFERLIHFTQNAFSSSRETSLEERYQYYRAQSIISRKVIKTLTHMNTQYTDEVYIPETFHKIIATYTAHKTGSDNKLAQLDHEHAAGLERIKAELSAKALRATGDKALRFFKDKGIADEQMAESILHNYTIR